MTGIYLIRNKLTDECYIGQSKNIANRFRSHKHNFKTKKYSLYSDMRHYGLDNFDFSVIEECLASELDVREMHWIKKYQKDGYYLYNIIGVITKERNYSRYRKHKTTSIKY